MLTSQHIEKCSKSPELAEESLQEILQFIASATDFQPESSKEFRLALEELTIPETRPLVTQVRQSTGGIAKRSHRYLICVAFWQVHQRLQDISMMCDKRIVSLKKMSEKPPPRPVQSVTAIPLSSPRNRVSQAECLFPALFVNILREDFSERAKQENRERGFSSSVVQCRVQFGPCWAASQSVSE